MCINGGGPILTWTAGGGLYFHDSYGNHVTTLETDNPHPACVQVYSPEEFCENSTIQVEDGCTDISMNLHKPDAIPLVLCDEENQDIVLAPGAYIDFTPIVHGGTPPYTGWSSDKLIYKGDGATGLFQAPDDFCGTASVTVMDSCMESADCTVRSTEGYWEKIDPTPYRCQSPASGLMVPESDMTDEMQIGWFIGGGYRAYIAHSFFGWSLECEDIYNSLVCPIGTILTTHSEPYWRNYCYNYGYTGYCGAEKEYSSGCCKNDYRGSNQCDEPAKWAYFVAADNIILLSRWTCNL